MMADIQYDALQNNKVRQHMQLPPKNNCRIEGKCQSKEIVYQATVTNEDDHAQKTYVGLTEGAFKTRYLNHTSPFRNEKSKNATELSKHVWIIKRIKHAIFYGRPFVSKLVLLYVGF